MDDDTRELVRKLGTRFCARKDVKAFQQASGAWLPDRSPMKLSDFRNHLAGQKTMGHYMLSEDDRVNLFAFDIDIKKHNPERGSITYYVNENNERIEGDMREAWNTPGHPALPYLRRHLRCMAEGLAYATHRLTSGEVHVAVADSGGKGLHVYGFTGLCDAADAQGLAVDVLQSFGVFEPARGQNFWRHKGVEDAEGNVTTPYGNLEIEIFPKQTTLGDKDLGNLMRLPLGINAKTGRLSQFLRLDNGYEEEWNVLDPLKALGDTLPWPEG